MFRSVFTTLQLYIVTAAFPWLRDEKLPAEKSADVVSATLLRGSHATETSATVSTASKMALGHSYYAKECVDCFYTGTQCGCGPAMEYLACLTKHCYTSDQKKFATMCAVVQSHCYSELDIDCQGPETVCEAKFHQLSSGGLGLTWDPDASPDDAPLCGPFGTCIGEMHMKVKVHNAPAPSAPAAELAPPTLVSPTLAPPTLVPAEESKKAALPCETVMAVKIDKPRLWLECGLPNQLDADINKKEDWETCIVEVVGDSASCTLPMLTKLEAQQVVESYCVLTDGAGGNRLSQPLRRTIKNHHARPAGEPAVRPLQNAHDAIEGSGDSLDEAASARPPYMKKSDSEEKPAPPGEQIVKDISDLSRASWEGSRNAANGAREATRKQSERVGSATRKQTERVSSATREQTERVSRGAKDLKKRSEESGANARKGMNQGAKNVGDASSRAAQRAKDVASEKPPYMEDPNRQFG